MLGHYLSLIRFSHTLFALPFALWAALLAWHRQALELGAQLAAPPSAPATVADGVAAAEGVLSVPLLSVRWQELVGILAAMVAARSTAMAFNRLADREIDAHNPRTAGRHLPAGILSVGKVRMFAIGCAVAFVASTLLFLPNWLPLALSVPVLGWLCGYSYAKRFTSLAQFWLGAALGMAPVAAWIAIRGEAVLDAPADLLPAVVIGGAVLAWVAGFDAIYACQDYQFDRAAGLHSLPVRLGVAGALRLAAICHATMIGVLALLPLVVPQLGGVYWVGLGATGCLLAYEHWLVRPDDLDRVNLAFFHVNAVISVVLLAVGSGDALW